VEIIEALGFGVIEHLSIRGGSPCYEPEPRVVQAIKLDSEPERPPDRSCADLTLKRDFEALFEQRSRLGDAIVDVEVRPSESGEDTKPESKAAEAMTRAASDGLRQPEQTGDIVPKPEEAAPAQLATESTCKGRKRGPTRDYETAARVAEVVARVAPGVPWRSKLDEILMALDDAEIPTPGTWLERHEYRNWYAAAADDTSRGRHLAIEAIKHHLKRAKEKPTETIP
jgi:hypothetical protein